MRRVVLGLAIALTALAAACDEDASGPRACTLIGCQSGLTLDLSGDLPADFTIRLSADSDSTRTIECDPAHPCEPTVFVSDFTPPRVFIEIDGADLGFRQEFVPEYVTSRPNGPDCPPECRQARLDVVLPVVR